MAGHTCHRLWRACCSGIEVKLWSTNGDVNPGLCCVSMAGRGHTAQRFATMALTSSHVNSSGSRLRKGGRDSRLYKMFPRWMWGFNLSTSTGGEEEQNPKRTGNYRKWIHSHAHTERLCGNVFSKPEKVETFWGMRWPLHAPTDLRSNNQSFSLSLSLFLFVFKKWTNTHTNTHTRTHNVHICTGRLVENMIFFPEEQTWHQWEFKSSVGEVTSNNTWPRENQLGIM